jgi:hypothetical protein
VGEPGGAGEGTYKESNGNNVAKNARSPAFCPHLVCGKTGVCTHLGNPDFHLQM